ncbi:MAG: 1-acyl-sn-glycerol-3-phosphate acyltransferase [Oscillatoriales cyanobacterium C42_A2020_001]|nr:1-acyl-sn-glycerol-3-phosphate acyltransferase [Leptolyngbyaceae cyanobacterium C42_A2020_001]
MSYLRSRLSFIPDAFNPLVLRVTHAVLPLMLKLRLKAWLPSGIAAIEATNVEALVHLYQQFQAGKIRFLMAFRHPEVDDPLSVLFLLSRIVPRVARQKGILLKSPIHSHFIYDRGMPFWAGAWLGWWFSRLGGIPIHRGKRPADRVALRAARDLLINGKFPLSIAPEGGTNGHSEIVSELESGGAQLGFWCAEDLAKANRAEQVFIVPIGIQYHYTTPVWANLERVLSQLEKDCGLNSQDLEIEPDANRQAVYYQRLLRLSECLLSQLEDFYREFYHQVLPPLKLSDNDASSETNLLLSLRLQRLLNIALQVSEHYFNLESQAGLTERCRRIEEACWRYVYRDDVVDVKQLSSVSRGLGNWVAEEALLRVKHMRLVESFVAVTGTYVQEKPTVERFAEVTLILFDAIARIKGQKFPRRPRLGWRKSTITVGKPICITERWETYQSNRQAARQAVADVTQELQVALNKMIT